MLLIDASAEARSAYSPFGSHDMIDCDEFVRLPSVCSAYWYSEIASKFPTRATLPKDERSRFGDGTGVRVTAWVQGISDGSSKGHSRMIDTNSAAAGRNIEESLIAQTATTGKGEITTDPDWRRSEIELGKRERIQSDDKASDRRESEANSERLANPEGTALVLMW